MHGMIEMTSFVFCCIAQPESLCYIYGVLIVPLTNGCLSVCLHYGPAKALKLDNFFVSLFEKWFTHFQASMQGETLCYNSSYYYYYVRVVVRVNIHYYDWICLKSRERREGEMIEYFPPSVHTHTKKVCLGCCWFCSMVLSYELDGWFFMLGEYNNYTGCHPAQSNATFVQL